MNMRKIIAVLAAVLMLCAAIPMGATVSVSAATAILENDFEDGTVGTWSCHADDTIVVEDGAMKWTTLSWKNLYRYCTATAGKDYKLTFKMKAASAVTVDFKFLKSSWGESGITKYVGKNTADQANTWVEHTYVFNAGENTGLCFLLQSHVATDIYLDDFRIEEYIAPVDPEIPDDAIYFENFEGDHTWGTNDEATLETIPAGDAPVIKGENGNYVIKHTIPANKYPYISDRTGITVQPNTDYIVSFDVLNAEGNKNWPIQVIIAENYWLGGTFFTSASQQIKTSSSAWETYSLVFNSGDHDKIWLGAKSQWANATVYFDNFYIAPYHGGMSNDGYLKNGDFESDSLEWLHTSNTDVIADPTGAGQGNVMMTNENTSSLHMFSQNATNLVAGEQYTLTFKSYGYTTAVSNAAFFVKFPSSCSNFTFGGDLVGYIYSGTTLRFNVNTALNQWKTSTVTFTASSDVALIDFQNYRTNGGQYYFDDISITHVHKYEYACSDACSVCGAANPDVVDHNWVDADCDTAKTCSVCGATEGEALGHTPGAAADCDSAQVCEICGIELAPALGHTPGAAADCENAQTCTVCGVELAPALGHTPGAAADCENAQTCTVCGIELAPALGHTPGAAADCDSAQVCEICGIELAPATGEHAYVGEETQAPTCTETGVMTYTCSVCGDTYTEDIPAAHTYDNNCDFDCNACGEYRDAPHNLTTYVEAVVPTTCQEEGHNEYWICADCEGYFMSNGAGGYYETNPAWMYYTGDHVRPEGAIVCAVVPCELCNEDTYGEACTRPEGSPECTDTECVNCGETIYGWGHNYNTGDEEIPLPLCGEGDCVYCGQHFDKLYDHENGSWAPCLDGECSYGCGLAFPATENHVLEDCTAGGYCQVCWSEIPAGEHSYDNDCDADCNACGSLREVADHVYTDEFDTTCDICGAVREVVAPDSIIAFNGKSASEDVRGLAVKFTVPVLGMGIDKTTAIYDDATLIGYKLISMGAIASNGPSTIDIPVKYLCDDDVSSSAQFAIRIKNIPEDKGDVEITFTPYVIVEIAGEQVTIYGEEQTGTYNQVAG